MCAIVRWPLGSPHWFVFVKAFLLLGAVISAAILTVGRVERRGGSYALVLMSVLAVMFLPCLVWPFGRAVDLVVYPLLLGLFATGIAQTVAARLRMPFGQSLPAVGSGVLAGLGYFLLVNSLGLATVLSPEQTLVGVQNLDTLFHASIANMLIKQGALSTGLDGFVSIKYYFLSHIWLGCLGLWLGTDTLNSYYVGAQVVGIPLLFFSLSLASYLLRPPGKRLANGAPVVLFPLLLLLISELWGWTNYLVSESYFLAMIIFLLALPLVAELARTEKPHGLGRQLSCLVIAATLMALSKLSVGMVFCAVVGYLTLRQCLSPTAFVKLCALYFVPAALLAAVLFWAFGGMALWFDPLRFVGDYPEGAWPNIVANLALVCAAVAVWGLGKLQDRKCAEAFTIIAIAATLPALLLEVPGAAAYYFVNVGTFAAVVFIAAYGGPVLYRWIPKLFRPKFIVAAILLVTLDTDQKTNSPGVFADELVELRARTRGYLGEGAVPEKGDWQRLVALLAPNHWARRALGSDVKRLARAQSLQTLQDAGVPQTPGAAVFVPPENSLYWSIYRDCRATSFVIPAVLGVPMLRGLNPFLPECSNERYYGFPAYPPDAVSQPSTDSELCVRAAKSELKTVFVLSAPAVVRKIDCGGQQGKD
jgi:hypothetical protein